MARYTVEGQFRGQLYLGPSLERALDALGREIHLCRNEYHGPTDAKLYCDGVEIETALGRDGKMQVAPKGPAKVHPPSELLESKIKKWPTR